ncbi:MAG: hypothetical protein QOH06_5420 [Acidobacteriota bacterium]|jgi:ribosomal protein L37E|nr:hypothetical protein [Acidobacteriota bacterium]
MAIKLVTTAGPFQEMLDSVSFVYDVKMDQLATTRHETLHTSGFGPCMVVVVHHHGTRGGGLAHLSAPVGMGNFVRELTFLEAHIAKILSNLKVSSETAFDLVLIEGAWGRALDLPAALRERFRSCNVTDMRREDQRADNVVLYEPMKENVAYFNDTRALTIKKSTPYAGVLRAREEGFPSLFPRWQPDSERTSCNRCGKEFGFFRRRHHCRQCGLLFCAECSSKTKVLNYPAHENPASLRDSVKKAVRVCDGCVPRSEALGF